MIESLVAERKQSKETTKSEGKVLEEEEGADSDLNKDDHDDDDSEINRGVELILRNRRRPETPKTFQLKFSFFNREITFCLDIKKK